MDTNIKKRLIIAIDPDRCIGCGKCIEACLTGALQLVNGKAKLVDERLCDGFGSCIAVCPSEAIKLEYRKAEEFDWSLLFNISLNDLLRKLEMTSYKHKRSDS